MGFAEDLETILKAVPPGRQTALFSATMPPRIAAIAQRHLHNPKRVTIAREKTAAGKLPRVRQTAYIVARAAQGGGAGPGARDRTSEGRHRVLPDPRRSGPPDRHAVCVRLSRRGVARRHGAARPRQGDERVSRGRRRVAHRHRRGRARPRHRASVARVQLRRAGSGRRLRAPHRPNGACRP